MQDVFFSFEQKNAQENEKSSDNNSKRSNVKSGLGKDVS